MSSREAGRNVGVTEAHVDVLAAIRRLPAARPVWVLWVTVGLVAVVLGGCGGAGDPKGGATLGGTASSSVQGAVDAVGGGGTSVGGGSLGAGSATTVTTSPAVPAGAGVGADPAVVITPTGVVAPVVGRAGGGFLVRTPCGSTAAVARAAPVGPVAVVIDPGHGGDERGTIGPNGLDEATLNLAVAQRAAAALAAAGFPTLLTRTTDIRVTLATRAEIAQRVRPRAFVSVHHNADPDGPSDRPGTETYYQVASATSRRLAGLVYEEVARALTPYGVPWVADTDAGAKYRRNDRGGDYYGILRRTAGIPAVLAELAYLSNPPEAELLTRPDVQRTEGEAVARGVVRFLTTDDPGSGYTEPYPRTTPAGSGGGAEGCVDPPLS